VRAPDVNHSQWDSVLEPGPRAADHLHELHKEMREDIRTTHAVRLGLREIDVNHSDWDCTLEQGALRLGLRQVDGLQREAAERVVVRRPYGTVEELRSRGGVPVHAIQRLAAADAFRSMGLDRRAALWDSRALRQAPDLPLFAYAETCDEGGEETPAQLPAMPLAEHVISDYQTIRLSLKAHPMHFLRAHYTAQKFIPAGQLAQLRDGKRLSMAGVVLIRQRPGTSKGVVFVTIEDETGIANLVVWPAVFEKQRKIVMGARLMAVHGVVQKDPDSEVIHVVAARLEDHTHLLSHLSDDSVLPKRLEKPDGHGSWGAPSSRHPRNVEIIPKSRDFH